MHTTETHPLWLVEAITLRTETYWNRNGRRIDDTYRSVLAIANVSTTDAVSAIRKAVLLWADTDRDVLSATEYRASLIPE